MSGSAPNIQTEWLTWDTHEDPFGEWSPWYTSSAVCISVKITEPFPGRNRLQMGWLLHCCPILRYTEPRVARHAYRTIAPFIFCTGLDDIVTVLSYPIRWQNGPPHLVYGVPGGA